MPGSSLWLLPPSSHALQPVFTSLIRKTSSIFNSPHLFIPHITLTSSVSPSTYEPDPQRWLDNLALPSLESEPSVHVGFKGLESKDIFVKKLYVQVEKPGLEKLARVTRMTVAGYEDPEVAKKWVEEEYKPHLSLL
jgi:2',3'-cyclic-nucleotide 3'-phosphodiesterase